MTDIKQSGQNTVTKPLLSARELVKHLGSADVTFDLCSEADATEYLTQSNNYLRAASYRKLFPRHSQGANVDSFVNLDFAYLMELASIDRMLREALLALSIGNHIVL